MRIQYSHLGFCFTFSLLLATFCCADNRKIEVTGFGECVDCKESNIKTNHAFSGLRVTIDCKAEKGEFKTRGVGELDEEGKFTVGLPEEILKDEKLGEECYAQLHSASLAPCPAHNGLENSKIVFHSRSEKTHTFAPIGKLKISTELCTSAFLWPHYKYPHLPKLPPLDKWKKPLSKLTIPQFKKIGHSFPPFHKKPLLPPVPIYKKPILPPVPVYKKPLLPPVPVYKKPLLPPVPIYKKPLPTVPVYKKPLPPIVPIYKKPVPPVPTYKPTPPIVKPKPTVPIYKKTFPPVFKPHPVYKKPLPSFHKPLPSIFKKKPCPPVKIPHIPKIIPKFHHPKFGSFSPISVSPHP